MATRASLLSFSPFPSSPLRPRRLHRRQHYLLHSSSHSFSSLRSSSNPTNPRTSFINLTFASLPASFDGVSSDNDNRGSKKSILLNLVQEIEPLDVSIIQKDVPLTTIDAMKRTISGMLGLLPSDQFHVSVEALWEPLSKLFISSMMTGYTLKNAEHRLCLEMIFDVVDEVGPETPNQDDSKVELRENIHHDYGNGVKTSMNNVMLEPGTEKDISPEGTNVQGLGEITPEARQYILHLQSQLSSVKKELHEVKQKSAALQMQQFVGEEKNDLLDYLRSLEPEKVVELSEPTCPELKEAIHSVVHGLLATLSPEMQSKAPPPPPPPECMSIEKVIFEDDEEDRVDIMDNTPLQYQPLISLTRDYLARLIFWCMLFGHYLRDVEYRLELVDLLCVRSNAENGS